MAEFGCFSVSDLFWVFFFFYINGIMSTYYSATHFFPGQVIREGDVDEA